MAARHVLREGEKAPDSLTQNQKEIIDIAKNASAWLNEAAKHPERFGAPPLKFLIEWVKNHSGLRKVDEIGLQLTINAAGRGAAHPDGEKEEVLLFRAVQEFLGSGDAALHGSPPQKPSSQKQETSNASDATALNEREAALQRKLEELAAREATTKQGEDALNVRIAENNERERRIKHQEEIHLTNVSQFEQSKRESKRALEEQSRDLAAREGELNRKLEELTKKEEALQEQKRTCSETISEYEKRAEELKRQEKALAARIADIEAHDVALRSREGALTDLHAAVFTQRIDDLVNRELSLEEQNGQLAIEGANNKKLLDNILEKEQDLAQKIVEMQNWESRLKEQQEALDKQKTQIREQKAALEQQKAELAAKEAELGQRKAAIQEPETKSDSSPPSTHETDKPQPEERSWSQDARNRLGKRTMRRNEKEKKREQRRTIFPPMKKREPEPAAEPSREFAPHFDRNNIEIYRAIREQAKNLLTLLNVALIKHISDREENVIKDFIKECTETLIFLRKGLKKSCNPGYSKDDENDALAALKSSENILKQELDNKKIQQIYEKNFRHLRHQIQEFYHQILRTDKNTEQDTSMSDFPGETGSGRWV